MSAQKWLDAAHQYDANRRQAKPEQKSVPVPIAPVAVRTPGTTVAEISEAISNFLSSSEGIAAMRLLRAAGQFVRLSDANEGGGIQCVIFLDGTGLHECIERTGTGRIYANQEDTAKSREKSISAYEAAQDIISASEGKATADMVLSSLRRDLDRIAAAASDNK